VQQPRLNRDRAAERDDEPSHGTSRRRTAPQTRDRASRGTTPRPRQSQAEERQSTTRRSTRGVGELRRGRSSTERTVGTAMATTTTAATTANAATTEKHRHRTSTTSRYRGFVYEICN
jgi:hypothetical protein